MKAVIAAFMFVVLPLCRGASTDVLLLAARSLYQETQIVQDKWLNDERARVAEAGFRFAYVHDKESGQGFIYSIEHDTLVATELSPMAFASEQELDPYPRSIGIIGIRFLAVTVEPFEDGLNLDIGFTECFGRTASLLWSEDEKEFVLKSGRIKCCF